MPPLRLHGGNPTVNNCPKRKPPRAVGTENHVQTGARVSYQEKTEPILHVKAQSAGFGKTRKKNCKLSSTGGRKGGGPGDSGTGHGNIESLSPRTRGETWAHHGGLALCKTGRWKEETRVPKIPARRKNAVGSKKNSNVAMKPLGG